MTSESNNNAHNAFPSMSIPGGTRHGERSTCGAQLLGHHDTTFGYLLRTAVPHQPKIHCIINKIIPTRVTSANLSAKIFSVLRRFLISCSQSKSIVSPPSALVPPCAGAMRGVSTSPRHPDAPLFFQFLHGSRWIHTPTPLSVQGARAGQQLAQPSAGPLPHSSGGFRMRLLKYRCVACGRVTIQPSDEDDPRHEIRSWFCGCPFEPPGDLPQTGSPDSPEASRLGDVYGAL